MCGIAGIVSSKKQVIKKEDIGLLTDPIAHRGPDDVGVEIFDYAGLGHRRLSIIDLSYSIHSLSFPIIVPILVLMKIRTQNENKPLDMSIHMYHPCLKFQYPIIIILSLWVIKHVLPFM